MQSCNIFFYHTGELMGVEGTSFWARQFGFSQRPGTGLVEEVSGIVPLHGTKGEARMLAIGQSGLAVTPLHVANAMATLARNGQFRSPKIVMGPAAGGQDPRALPGEEELYAAVRRGMDKVVNDPHSMTAYKYFHGPGVEELPFSLCGKTGTAQTGVRRVDTDADGRTDVTLSGNMVWFAGFAPKDQPKVAFAVMLEYVSNADGGGGKNCAPIAREALRIWHRMGYLKADQTDVAPH
jgi:penicillin-binding protein 2